jgi:hypothetical protein
MGKFLDAVLAEREGAIQAGVQISQRSLQKPAGRQSLKPKREGVHLSQKKELCSHYKLIPKPYVHSRSFLPEKKISYSVPYPKYCIQDKPRSINPNSSSRRGMREEPHSSLPPHRVLHLVDCLLLAYRSQITVYIRTQRNSLAEVPAGNTCPAVVGRSLVGVGSIRPAEDSLAADIDRSSGCSPETGRIVLTDIALLRFLVQGSRTLDMGPRRNGLGADMRAAGIWCCRPFWVWEVWEQFA